MDQFFSIKVPIGSQRWLPLDTELRNVANWYMCEGIQATNLAHICYSALSRLDYQAVSHQLFKRFVERCLRSPTPFTHFGERGIDVPIISTVILHHHVNPELES